MGMLRFAFAAVESKSLSSWMWFCERLRVAIDRSEIEICVVVLDRDGRLKEAMATVTPSANHRFCLRHLVAKMKNKF
jgi:transposase-like protein